MENEYKVLDLKVDSVLENDTKSTLVFDCRKKNGLPKRIAYYRNNHKIAHSMVPFVFLDSDVFQCMEVKPITKHMERLEIICDHMEAIILKATAIKRNGSKIVLYVDDNYAR